MTLLDEQRRRLARDLHDGIQQRLVVLRMRLGVARWTLPDDPPRAQEVWSELAGELDRIIDDLRETSRGIFPSLLADRGLAAALHGHLGRLPVSVRLHLDRLPRLRPEVESSAFFLVSEAVTNALKHAGPSLLTITVSVRGDDLAVAVADDGRGFNPRPVAGGGLGHMRDRVAALGGTLTVASRPGSGTEVRAVLPLRPRPPSGGPARPAGERPRPRRLHPAAR